VRRNSIPLLKYILLAGIVLANSLVAQAQIDLMLHSFQDPPDSAKPGVWWQWMNGNVTQPGITADLEWMHRVRIGGMTMIDGDISVPVYVDKPLIWMTPAWKAAWRHSAAEADRLHLKMSMASSGGWSETGGPWVKPEQGMKKYVWSETRVRGPRRFDGLLEHPPTVSGKFQNRMHPAALRIIPPGAKPQPPAPPVLPLPTFYADTAVVAYRMPEGDVRMADLHPRITSSQGSIDGDLLMDSDWNKTVELSFPNGSDMGWIQFDFQQPYRTYAVTIASGSGKVWGGDVLPHGEVQASLDGTTWTTLVDLPGAAGSGLANLTVRTYAFPETTARYYRVWCRAPELDPLGVSLGAPQPHSVDFSQIEFHSTPRLNYWEAKASFLPLMDASESLTPNVTPAEAIAKNDVVDLTSHMKPDGTLDWEVPAGNWAILRMGYSLTGEKNHPATPAATGLEVDKLSRSDVDSYLQQYTKMISDIAGPYFGKSFRYFLMDSWEVGEENWTGHMMAEFQKRRGYSMTPYLPVLTGRVVGSTAISEAFLWDFRRTIADMLAENYYANATKYFNKLGIGLEAEAMGVGLPATGDGLLNKGRVNIPMGEFWTPLPGEGDTPDHTADIREASSASHIYGKPVTAAESFTAWPQIPGWAQSPFYLKPLADEHFAAGINRILFDTSVEQPFVDDAHRPGVTLGAFGVHYTRNITWAEQAVAWNTYLARCSYLLQQGSYVADVAYFYGEGAPATVPFWRRMKPAVPTGYGYDYINSDVLLNHASAEDGRLKLSSGMTYRLLVLPDDVHEMSIPLLKKIRALIAAGGIVLSPKPTQSPSLSDGANAKNEVQSIADEIWGPANVSGPSEHNYGKGKVYTGYSIEQVLKEERVPMDLEYISPNNVGTDIPYGLPKGNTDDDLTWIHRHLSDEEIYFVSTQKAHPFEVNVTFRVDGYKVELWHPETGAVEAASYKSDNGRTMVHLRMDPEGSVFVVFRGRSAAPYRSLPSSESHDLATIDGGWRVAFPPNLGAPPQIDLDKLISWTKVPDDGVRYFSGTASYTKDIDASGNWFRPGARIMLDLGVVKEIAEVSVNGNSVGGILWKWPYLVDMTSALKPGKNHIEVKVTNLWPNRMIGDRQVSVTRTYTFTDYDAYSKSSPLLESGMLGPVKISSSAR
jgi:hypothetical protein